MAKLPELPVELGNADGVQRTASTPTDYWNLVARGFTVDQADSNLSPQQKAARTRAAKKAEETSHDGPDTTDAGTNQT